MTEEIAELVALAERVSGDPQASIRIRRGPASEGDAAGWSVSASLPGLLISGDAGADVATGMENLKRELLRYAREEKGRLRKRLGDLGEGFDEE